MLLFKAGFILEYTPKTIQIRPVKKRLGAAETGGPRRDPAPDRAANRGLPPITAWLTAIRTFIYMSEWIRDLIKRQPHRLSELRGPEALSGLISPLVHAESDSL